MTRNLPAALALAEAAARKLLRQQAAILLVFAVAFGGGMLAVMAQPSTPPQPSIGHWLYAQGYRTTAFRAAGSQTRQVNGAFNPNVPMPQGSEPDFFVLYGQRYGIVKDGGTGQFIAENGLSQEAVERAVTAGIIGPVVLPTTVAGWREALTDLAVVKCGQGNGLPIMCWTYYVDRVVTPPVDPPATPTPPPPPAVTPTPPVEPPATPTPPPPELCCTCQQYTPVVVPPEVSQTLAILGGKRAPLTRWGAGIAAKVERLRQWVAGRYYVPTTLSMGAPQECRP